MAAAELPESSLVVSVWDFNGGIVKDDFIGRIVLSSKEPSGILILSSFINIYIQLWHSFRPVESYHFGFCPHLDGFNLKTWQPEIIDRWLAGLKQAKRRWATGTVFWVKIAVQLHNGTLFVLEKNAIRFLTQLKYKISPNQLILFFLKQTSPASLAVSWTFGEKIEKKDLMDHHSWAHHYLTHPSYWYIDTVSVLFYSRKSLILIFQIKRQRPAYRSWSDSIYV